MELVRSGFSMSPASEGSWKEEEEEEVEGAPQVLFSTILLLCAVATLWARVPLSLFVVWCAVFLSFVDRPEMLGIIACVYQKDSSTLVVVYGSGVRDAGLDGLRLRFLLASPGPGCSASWADMDQKDSSLRALVVTTAVACARLVLLVILHLALSLSPSCRQARMLAILAGMDLIDSYVICWWFRLQETVGVSAVAVHQGRRLVLRGTQAASHGPCDHGVSPVARGHGGSHSCSCVSCGGLWKNFIFLREGGHVF